VKLIDLIVAIFVVATAVSVSISYIKFPSSNMYDAVSLKASILKDLNIMREEEQPSSVLIIRKSYKRLILGRDFRKTDKIHLKSIYSSCSDLMGRIEYKSVFPRCAGTIYANGWSMSFQPVTGYMTIKLNKR